jgi:hypothetical protein
VIVSAALHAIVITVMPSPNSRSVGGLLNFLATFSIGSPTISSFFQEANLSPSLSNPASRSKPITLLWPGLGSIGPWTP